MSNFTVQNGHFLTGSLRTPAESKKIWGYISILHSFLFTYCDIMNEQDFHQMNV